MFLSVKDNKKEIFKFQMHEKIMQDEYFSIVFNNSYNDFAQHAQLID